MTVLTAEYKVEYTGDGTTTQFFWNFPVLEEGHMKVLLDDVEQSPATYTLAGIGVASGGSCTFNTAPADGVEVELRRVVPVTQLLDLRQYDPFDADSLEKALDLLTMQVQQVIIGEGIYAPSIHTHPAVDISYDSTLTGINATEVQGAIDTIYQITGITRLAYKIITDDAGDGTPEGDLNFTDFTAQEGTPTLSINDDTAYIFLHKQQAYHWIGPRNVTLGIGGSHTAIAANLFASITSTAANIGYDDTGNVHVTGPTVQAALDTTDDVLQDLYSRVTSALQADRAGILFYFAGSTAPDGALACNGQALAIADYPNLYNAIGDAWNTTAGLADPGAGNFRLPPCYVNGRGVFHRSTYDGQTVGLWQGQQNEVHTHTGPNHRHGINHDHPSFSVLSSGAGGHSHGITFDTTGQISRNGDLTMVDDIQDKREIARQTDTVGNHSHWVTINIPNLTGVYSAYAGAGDTGKQGGTALRPECINVLTCIWHGNPV